MNDKKSKTASKKAEKNSDMHGLALPQEGDAGVEKEIGGFEKRLEPTRYGDWDVNGRCSDF